MAQRRRVGLIFSYSEEWIAGTYYILNIINALKTLPKAEMPVIVLISEKIENFQIAKNETAYPFLEFIQTPILRPKYNSFERLINKLGSKIGLKKIFDKKPLRADIGFLYPFEADVSIKPVKKVNWVPDFQEIHLPHLFSEELLAERKKNQEEVVCKGDWVVFSSEDSQKDFNLVYPDAIVQQYVLPFAVTHPSFENLEMENLQNKYDLPQNYYFAPNQFWAHKNHLVILKAIHRLKQKNVEIHMAFSGKENDHRNADYVSILKNYIAENNLESNISFLGFIPRDDQLKLMQNAVAMVQPSKFEGWSTVVEDAKALNQFILVSNLAVHEEQLKKNMAFFHPDNDEELALLLKKYWEEKPKIESYDYQEDRLSFAKNFINMVSEMSI